LLFLLYRERISINDKRRLVAIALLLLVVVIYTGYEE
jgi:hypothetical protein